MPQDEDAAAARLLEDEAQAAHLLGAIRREVALHRKEVVEQVGQLGEVLQGRLLDMRLIHVGCGLWQSRAGGGRRQV